MALLTPPLPHPPPRGGRGPEKTMGSEAAPSVLTPSPLVVEGWGEGATDPAIPSSGASAFSSTTRQATPATSAVVPPIGPAGRSSRPARALIRLDLPALMIP